MLSHAECVIPDDAVLIRLNVYAYDPMSGNNIPRPKAPGLPLSIWTYSGSLLFPQPFSIDVPVELRDANGNVVYSDVLLAGSTTLSLPSSLSGDYTLLLYLGDFCYGGDIHL